jgi:peptidoglycan/xylan/chitin deacetylase (PgdA/CDA1 family)
MRLRRPLFAVLAIAVFGVSLGAGAAVGYGDAAAPTTAMRPAGGGGVAGGAAAGTGAELSTPAATAAGPSEAPAASPTDIPSTGPSEAPAVGSPGSSAGPSPAPGRTPTATWPLVAADAPGPPPGFAIRVPVLMYHRVAPADQVGRSLPGLVVPPDLFAAQLEALVAVGWRSITAAQLAADLAVGLVPPPRTFVITFDDGRRDAYTEAFPILQRLGLVATFYVITGRINDTNSLTASQLRRLASTGMEIGSHTVDHVRLSSANPLVAHFELTGSAARIAAVTGQRPTTFAYPFGGLNPLDQGLVQEAGYAMAFTEADGCTMSWPTRLASPRVRVSPGTTPADLLHEVEVCTTGG